MHCLKKWCKALVQHKSIGNAYSMAMAFEDILGFSPLSIRENSIWRRIKSYGCWSQYKGGSIWDYLTLPIETFSYFVILRGPLNYGGMDYINTETRLLLNNNYHSILCDNWDTFNLSFKVIWLSH